MMAWMSFHTTTPPVESYTPLFPRLADPSEVISSELLPKLAGLSPAPRITVSGLRDLGTGKPTFCNLDGLSGSCLGCGASIPTKMNKGRVSKMCRPCYHKARASIVEFNCSVCDDTVYEDLGTFGKRLTSGAFTCGRACMGVGYAEAATRKLCRCGKPLLKARKFCSHPCRMKYGKTRKYLPDITCPMCGAVFSPHSSRRRYCTRKCADRAHSIRMRGKGNSHFKTGSSYTYVFRNRRQPIMQLDGGCVVCGMPDDLLVHHVDHNPQNNDWDNLVTLCKTHHAVHHKSASTPFPWLSTYAKSRLTSTTSPSPQPATSTSTAS